MQSWLDNDWEISPCLITSIYISWTLHDEGCGEALSVGMEDPNIIHHVAVGKREDALGRKPSEEDRDAVGESELSPAFSRRLLRMWTLLG